MIRIGICGYGNLGKAIENEIIKEAGEVTFKAKYTPSDTTNYEIVENIDIVVSVEEVETKMPEEAATEEPVVEETIVEEPANALYIPKGIW